MSDLVARILTDGTAAQRCALAELLQFENILQNQQALVLGILCLAGETVHMRQLAAFSLKARHNDFEDNVDTLCELILELYEEYVDNVDAVDPERRKKLYNW